MKDLTDDGSETVFRDVIFLALAGFITIVLLLLPLINPPEASKNDDDRPGNIAIEARWPDNTSFDVDTWVKAPFGAPVGFQNTRGPTFNLLRDDLGFTHDVTNLNYEFVYSRGVPAGEYVVNLVLYSNHAKEPLPVEVSVAVSVRKPGERRPVAIYSAKVKLEHVKHEITVVRFTLDEEGNVVPGSINQVPKMLYTATTDTTIPSDMNNHLRGYEQ